MGSQGKPDLARGPYECQGSHGFDHLGSLSPMPLLCTYSLEILSTCRVVSSCGVVAKTDTKLCQKGVSRRHLKTEKEEEVPFQMVIIRLITISSYTEK